jgi:DNA repair exonuclease SbcCD nuclease subunit
MKIAIMGDTHLGYSRFFDDSISQAEAAFKDANEKADLILFLGDLYDSRVPTLQVLGEAVSMFRKLTKRIYAIHGNHERRSRGALNPVELLEKAGLLTHLHLSGETFEKDGEKVFIAGMGNVPDDLSGKALEKLRETVSPPEGTFSILLLHQSFTEYVYGDNLPSIHDLEELGYSLYLNGHIHARKEGMEGRFLIPGSTVLTQLTKEETKPKGYILYDTESKKHEFIQIPSREFIYEEMNFDESSPDLISKKVAERTSEIRARSREAVIRLLLKGSLAQGFRGADLSLPQGPNTYIENRLNQLQLKNEMEKIAELRKKSVSVQELSEQRLREKLGGKIASFDPQGLFEHLLEGPEAGREYLKRQAPK